MSCTVNFFIDSNAMNELSANISYVKKVSTVCVISRYQQFTPTSVMHWGIGIIVKWKSHASKVEYILRGLESGPYDMLDVHTKLARHHSTLPLYPNRSNTLWSSESELPEIYHKWIPTKSFTFTHICMQLLDWNWWA